MLRRAVRFIQQIFLNGYTNPNKDCKEMEWNFIHVHGAYNTYNSLMINELIKKMEDGQSSQNLI